MSTNNRIALIHATRVAMEPIESAAKNLWPEADLFSILEEALSADRASERVPPAQLHDRIVEIARYAEKLNPDGILYTCSAFGEGIERAAATSHLPVLKPNEAMFDHALSHGDNLVMIYTFTPSVAGMEKEFYQETAKRQSNATIRSVYAEGAREALDNGDIDTHNSIVANTAKTIDHADAILLAHFSTATAASLTRAATTIPVLTSPESAISKMKQLVSDSAQ